MDIESMSQFVVIGWDGPDGPARRKKNRDKHVAHIEALDREGRIVLAGPIRDDADNKSIGAVIVLTAANLDEARNLVSQDPYVTGQVFETITVNAFNRVFPKKP